MDHRGVVDGQEAWPALFRMTIHVDAGPEFGSVGVSQSMGMVSESL
ncbi:MAG: hypothetical protein L0Y44_12635 [Phycisphaerales bacterium]|nr:hypothetical protein [Phycisphaerales bacterium]